MTNTNYRDLPHTGYKRIKPERYFDVYEDQKGANTGLLIAFIVVGVIAGGLLMLSGGSNVGEQKFNATSQGTTAPVVKPE